MVVQVWSGHSGVILEADSNNENKFSVELSTYLVYISATDLRLTSFSVSCHLSVPAMDRH